MSQPRFIYDINATASTFESSFGQRSLIAILPSNSSAQTANTILVEQSKLATILQLFIIAIIMAVSLIGNTLILMSVYKIAYLRSISSYLVANLAIIDLGLSFLILPTVASTIVNREWKLGQALCISTGCVDTLLTNAQVMALLAIGINRYTAMLHPQWYNSHKSKRFYMFCASGGWIYAALWSIPPLFGWGRYSYTPGTLFCGVTWKKAPYYAISHLAASYVIPSFAGLYFYVGVVRAVFKYVKQVGVHTDETGMLGMEERRGTLHHNRKEIEIFVERKRLAEDIRLAALASVSVKLPKQGTVENGAAISSVHRSDHNKHLYQVTKAFLVIIVTFLACWIPRGIANIWAVAKGRNLVPLQLETYSTLLIFATSALNPIVYGFCRADFRKAFKAIVCCSLQGEN